MSAVPTACGGTLSVTSTLKWALSAMMKNPHTSATGRKQPERTAESEANQGAADSADGQRNDDEPWAADAIGHGAAPHAADAAHGNDGKAADRCGAGWRGVERVRRSGDAGGEER